jgi:class 3 adenylate cyclase/TolB-like protein/Flp pilus assembly protein TadD
MSEVSPVPPGRTQSAILCADVHGYSRLMARNEERTQARVNRSINLMRSLVGEYGGRVASVAGDGVIALFASALQALEFGCAIQNQFRDQAVWNLGDDPLTFRIGISHGEVFFGEGNVKGHSVNVAARIQALAQPGGICITDAVERAAREQLSGRVRPLGLKWLKNIDDPVEVFALDVHGGESPAAALVPTASAGLQVSRPAVAVEPFLAISGSQDETYLALAMSESLTLALSRFNWLTVKEDRASALITPVLGGPANETFVADGDYVVAGRLLRMQGSLRLLAKLREHPGGRIIWTSGTDLRAGHSFKRLDELAAVLAARLDRQILMAEVARAWQKPPDGLDAHDYVMRAVPLLFQMSKESLRQADQLLRAAEGGQPRSSRNQALRAFGTLLRIGQQWAGDPQAAVDEIDWLTRSAIEYGPTDPVALALRGHVESFVFHRFDSALDCFARALQSNPSEPFGWAFSAVTLSYLGRTQEALSRLERYRELCPLDPYPFYFNTAFTLTYALAGEYQKAVEVGRRVVAENPNYYAAYRPLITSLGRLGQVDEARGLLDKLLVNEPQFSIGWFRSRYPPLLRDQLEPYLAGFREVGVPEG